MMVPSCSAFLMSSGGVSCGVGCCDADLAGGATVVFPFIGRSAEPDVPSAPAPPPGLMGPDRVLKGACRGCGEGASGTWEGCCVFCAIASGLKPKPRSAATTVIAKPGFTGPLPTGAKRRTQNQR